MKSIWRIDAHSPTNRERRHARGVGLVSLRFLLAVRTLTHCHPATRGLGLVTAARWGRGLAQTRRLKTNFRRESRRAGFPSDFASFELRGARRKPLPGSLLNGRLRKSL
jgi:hypothetical protein